MRYLIWFNHPRTGIGVVLGLSAVILLIIGLSWRGGRVSSAREQLFHEDPGMEAIMVAQLVQAVNLPQTQQNVTITLHSVYVDEHRLLLGFTTYHPIREYHVDVQDVDVSTDTMNAADANGGDHTRRTAWDERTVGGSTHRVDGGCGWLPICRETGSMYSADTFIDLGTNPARHTADSGAPPLLRHLRVTARAVVLRPGSNDVDLDAAPPIGPFVFEVNVLVHPAHRVVLHRSVEVGRDRVTLEEVEMTPSMIRARFCSDPPNPDTLFPRLEMVTNTGQPLKMNAGSYSYQPDCATITGYGTGNDPSGTWTMRVTSLGNYTSLVEGSEPFQVTIP